jgi:hypothetical protein
MDTAQLTSLVSVLVVLSIASERLVEILKGVITPLNIEQSDPVREGWRRAAIQVLAVGAGIFTAFLARSLIPEGLIPTGPWPVLALGLLASGGSGFWNSILGYLTQVKDLKKLQVQDKQGTMAAGQRAQA